MTRLLESVKKSVHEAMPWRERLSKQALAEIESVRIQFKDGLLGTKPYPVAVALIQAAKERNWPMPSTQTVFRWLRN